MWEVIGEHFSVFYTQEDVEGGHPEEQLAAAAREGRFEEENMRVRKDGSRFWADVVITALTDEAGNLRGFSQVTRDITERMKAEEALTQSEERYRAVVKQSAEGLYLVDGETRRILETNPALQKMLGYTEEELRGMELHEIVAHERESVEANVERTLREGKRFIRERRYLRKDGREVDVEFDAPPGPRDRRSTGGRERARRRDVRALRGTGLSPGRELEHGYGGEGVTGS
jgi:PAS domain S-box-containing protein